MKGQAYFCVFLNYSLSGLFVLHCVGVFILFYLIQEGIGKGLLKSHCCSRTVVTVVVVLLSFDIERYLYSDIAARRGMTGK